MECALSRTICTSPKEPRAKCPACGKILNFNQFRIDAPTCRIPRHSDDRLRAQVERKRSGEIEDRQARDLVELTERISADPRLAARFVAALLAAHASANPDAPERAPAPHSPMPRPIPLTPEEWKAFDPDPEGSMRAAAYRDLEAIKVGDPEVSMGNERHTLGIVRVDADTFHVNGPHPFPFTEVHAALVAIRSGAE